VAVDIEGQAYIGVPKKLLHEPGIYALLQQERAASMPQIVKASAFREPSALERGFESAVEVATPQGSANCLGKDKPSSCQRSALYIRSSSCRLLCILRAATALRVSRILRPLPLPCLLCFSVDGRSVL
jgi:hypothetical protein